MVTGAELTETRLMVMPGRRPESSLDWDVT